MNRYVRIENSKLYLFLISISILFFWDLGLEFNMITHVTVTWPHITMENSRKF